MFLRGSASVRLVRIDRSGGKAGAPRRVKTRNTSTLYPYLEQGWNASPPTILVPERALNLRCFSGKHPYQSELRSQDPDLALRDLDTLGQRVQKPGVASTWVWSTFMPCDLWIVTG